MSYPQAESESFFDAFNCDYRIVPRALYMDAISSRAVSMLALVCVCAILYFSRHDLTTAFMRWEIGRTISWLAVTPKPVAQFLLFFVGFDTVSVSF